MPKESNNRLRKKEKRKKKEIYSNKHVRHKINNVNLNNKKTKDKKKK